MICDRVNLSVCHLHTCFSLIMKLNCTRSSEKQYQSSDSSYCKRSCATLKYSKMYLFPAFMKDSWLRVTTSFTDCLISHRKSTSSRCRRMSTSYLFWNSALILLQAVSMGLFSRQLIGGVNINSTTPSRRPSLS